MSGGSWEYTYGRINDVVDGLRNNTCLRGYKLELNAHQIAARQKLAGLLEQVSAALHAIEWVDSSDSSYPEDTDAIERVFAHVGKVPLIEVRRTEAGQLDEVVAREATVQLEDMGSSWSLIIDAGGAQLNMSLGGRLRRPLIVEQNGSVVLRQPKR